MDLFEHNLIQRKETEAPLTKRMRLRTLDEFVSHLNKFGYPKQIYYNIII